MCTVVLIQDTPVSACRSGWFGQYKFHPTGAYDSTVRAVSWRMVTEWSEWSEWSQNHAVTWHWRVDTPAATLQHRTPRLSTLFCAIQVWLAPSAVRWPKCLRFPYAGSNQLGGPVMCDVCKWFSKYIRMICFFFQKYLAQWSITIGIPTSTALPARFY